jgi:Zincin-like metallopeptidase
MGLASKWQNLASPTLADFEMMASAAWDRLPADFRKMCGDLVIRVEDFAEDDVLDELGIDDPFDLMGLYQGISLDKRVSATSPANRIWYFCTAARFLTTGRTAMNNSAILSPMFSFTRLAITSDSRMPTWKTSRHQ